MMNMLDELEARLRNMSPETTYETRLWVGRTPDGVFVDFFGEPFSEEYSQFLLSLRSPETSKTLAAVRMSGPDEGSNGTKNWDLSELVAGEHLFPMLRSFHVERGLPGEHNRAIVAESYEEDGVLARLLEKAPDLMSLSSPSAPDSDFFQVRNRPLRSLKVDAGYDHQNFIDNLANSSCFPDLTCLEFGEYNESYMDDFEASCTPFSHYAKMFRSKTGRNLQSFVWRNPIVTQEQLSELRTIVPSLQMQIVRWSAEYA